MFLPPPPLSQATQMLVLRRGSICTDWPLEMTESCVARKGPDSRLVHPGMPGS